jgi:pimeloyl-ACP methyl ester carboxylesterase
VSASVIGRIVDSEGVRITVRDHASGGEGTPLLLLHGGGRTLADWDSVVDELAPQRRVVTLDVRGHGQSVPAAGWPFDAVLADLDAVIAELDLGDPVVVGHSMGGLIASLYADTPRRVVAWAAKAV